MNTDPPRMLLIKGTESRSLEIMKATEYTRKMFRITYRPESRFNKLKNSRLAVTVRKAFLISNDREAIENTAMIAE
jgi:hypothetical protein